MLPAPQSLPRLRRARAISTPVLVFALVGLLVALGIRAGVIPQLPPGLIGPPAPTDRPPLPESLSAEPLLTPPPVPDGPGQYAFMHTQDRSVEPVAYDPCRPVEYVVRSEGVPPGALELLSEAAAEVSARTGLKFVYVGGTDEPVLADRESYQPDRYGERWAPVLVAFASEAEAPVLAGSTVGEAGSTLVKTEEPSSARYVTGTVLVDGPEVAAMMSDPASLPQAKAVMLHELAHLVGLAHVPDSSELMYLETAPERTGFGPGDLEGLALLGRGKCFRDL